MHTVSDNCTYDTGIKNPECVDAGCSMYDEIRNPGPLAEKTGDEDENYYEVAESSFTNMYDCGGTEICSDLTEQCTPEVRLFRGVSRSTLATYG